MDKKQGALLQSIGFAIEEIPNLKKVKRMDFVNKEGRLLPNLPVDDYHLKRWIARGFKVATKEASPLVCPECGAGPFKAEIGLRGHSRTHKAKDA